MICLKYTVKGVKKNLRKKLAKIASLRLCVILCMSVKDDRNILALIVFVIVVTTKIS